ncbi:MAG TPA: cysteine hydrolase [Pyrinomonadaceae bacterium]|nr:cysteine hydrolase [Pyrinomonadaceae bacterium]
MKREIHELSRREMLEVMAVSTLGGIAATAMTKKAAASRSSNSTKSRLIKIDAKPAPIAIDTAKTAVIVVDMENDFGSKGGMFDLAGIDISMIQKAVGPTAKVLAAARNANIKIVYLKMGFHPDLSDLGAPDSVSRMRHLQRMHVGKTVQAPDGSASRILIRDTWGTDIVPQLKPQAEDVVMYKTRFSGFYQTDLDNVLKKLGIKHLIFTGCTTSVCVDSTIRDAMFRDYQPLLLADCTGEPIGNGLSRSNHEATLLTIEVLLGWVSSSDEFIKALGVA